MPISRRRAKAKRHNVTPEAMEAYRLGNWPLLHRHLGLKPWETSPLDVESAEQPSPWTEGSTGARSWPQAVRLKAQLEGLKGV